MNPPSARSRWRALVALGAALLVVLALVAWWLLAPAAVRPGERVVPDLPAPPRQETIGLQPVPRWYDAVGTIHARTTATIAPRIQAQVLELTVDIGDRVEPGQVLVRLQSAELEARLEQARQSLAAAEALAEAARLDYARAEELHARGSITPQAFERAEAAHREAKARLAAAGQQVAEAEAVAAYRELVAPLAGVVRERLVDPGDLATPGQALLVVHDDARLRLEAVVREGLVATLERGAVYPARVQAIDDEVAATLSEIVPAADPRTRTVGVRLDLPRDERLYPGMFATLRIPLGEREAVLVPADAVTSVGQLDLLLVRVGAGADAGWQRRQVTLGGTVDDRREVLSGLRAGEVVGW